jgi:hypothetical protein
MFNQLQLTPQARIFCGINPHYTGETNIVKVRPTKKVYERKSNNLIHRYKGRDLSYWESVTGNTRRKIRRRIYDGWNIEDAIFKGAKDGLLP